MEEKRMTVAGGTKGSQHGSKNSGGGLHSVFGSIEQSPSKSGNGQYKSPRSSVEGGANSSQKPLSNPADNYQFLQGIREVDDD